MNLPKVMIGVALLGASAYIGWMLYKRIVRKSKIIMGTPDIKLPAPNPVDLSGMPHPMMEHHRDLVIW